MEKDIVREILISKEDLKKYFNNRKAISQKELYKYYRTKSQKTDKKLTHI